MGQHFTIENKVKTVFFRRFLGYVIYQWSTCNLHILVIFLKSFFFLQSVGHLWHSLFKLTKTNTSSWSVTFSADEYQTVN